MAECKSIEVYIKKPSLQGCYDSFQGEYSCYTHVRDNSKRMNVSSPQRETMYGEHGTHTEPVSRNEDHLVQVGDNLWECNIYIKMEDINETNGYSYYAQSYIIDYYSSLQDKGNSQHEDADSNNTGFLQTPDYSVLGFNPYSNNSWYGDHASREFAQTLQPPFEGIISMNNFSETGNNSFNYQHRDIYRGYNTHISFVDHMDIAANQYGYVQGQPVKQSHKDQSCFKPVFSKGSRKKGIRNVGL